MLWERRTDLQQAFPLSNTDEVDNFITWCLTDGIAGGQVAPELLDPEFLRALDAPVAAMTSACDDLPITRAVRMLYSRCEQRDAVARFPGDRNSRVQIALWLLLVASGKFRWPAALLGRVREYAMAPIASLAVAGVALPRLLLMLWEARDDLRAAFDPISENGRLHLLRWFLFLGMDEYGLAPSDLPAYLRDALRPSAAEPDRELPLLHQLILHQRDDVGAAFDVGTVDGRRGYLEWFAAHGVTELSGYSLLSKAKAKAARKPATIKRRKPADRPDIVLTGCLTEPSGRGEDIRMTMEALSAYEIPYATLDRKTGVVRHADGRILAPDVVGSARVNVVHLNADTAFDDYQFLRRYGLGRTRLIGYWAWELAKFPREYMRSFSFYDEVWASTRFAFNAFDIGYRPVSLMPMPVEVPAELPELDRAYFRLPSHRFLFLFNFDFGSFRARKNPDAVIAAFRRAFPSQNEPVALLIKTINAERHPDQWEGLRDLAQDDKRIIMRNGRYTREEMLNLIRLSDCYVSLHRSEGFGRGPAEAMLLGRPVVATNYSGNADFMNPENSFPVDYRLVPVGEGEYPGFEDQVWADADVVHAAEQLRRIYDDQVRTKLIAEQGRRFMRTHFSAEVIGARYVEALGELTSNLETIPRAGKSHRHRAARGEAQPTAVA